MLGGPSLSWFLQVGFTDASSTEQVTRQIKTFLKRLKWQTKCLQNYEIRIGVEYSFALSLTKSVTDFRH
jgi:hypothetical protein